MTGHLWLVRHGETTANTNAELDTQLPGAPLTDRGREQAREWGRQHDPRSIAVICTSEALRARQTGKYIKDGMREANPQLSEYELPELRIVPGLYETQVGDWEGVSVTEHQDVLVDWLRLYYRWSMGEQDVASPGQFGESWSDIRDRYLPQVTALAREFLLPHAASTAPANSELPAASETSEPPAMQDKHVVVVSHGAVTRLVTTMLAPSIDRRFCYWNFLSNLATIELSVEEGEDPAQLQQLQWQVLRWEDKEPPFECEVPEEYDDPEQALTMRTMP